LIELKERFVLTLHIYVLSIPSSSSRHSIRRDLQTIISVQSWIDRIRLIEFIMNEPDTNNTEPKQRVGINNESALCGLVICMVNIQRLRLEKVRVTNEVNSCQRTNLSEDSNAFIPTKVWRVGSRSMTTGRWVKL
jgi:hypothetical protein